MRKRKEIPKGLLEFGGSLGEPKWAGELMKRLLDLPENSLHETVKKHAAAMRKAAEAEAVASQLRAAARKIAEDTFRMVLKNWSIKEIQEATGYDDE